jgi:hypothetical protein
MSSAMGSIRPVRCNQRTRKSVSAEHRTLFATEPDRYAPQFGGFCTGGVALGRLSPIDPEAWLIVDGRLYLHYDKEGRDETAADPKANIAVAAESWEALGKTP